MDYRRHSDKTVLLYFKILILATYLGAVTVSYPFVPKQIFGFALSGYAWLLTFVVSLYFIIFVTKRTMFPIWVWLPWVSYIFISLVFNFSLLGLQSTIQLIVPILVGFVAGGFEYNDLIFKRILSYLKYMLIVIFLSATIISYLFYGIWGFGPASYAHLSAVGAVISIGMYYHTNKLKYLFFYVLVLIIPTVSVTRMGIAIVLIVPILYFSKYFGLKRIVLIGIIVLISNLIFFLPTVQNKMFYSGSGDLSELNISNQNLQTSGRRDIAEYALRKAKDKPLFGHGPRADYYLLKKKSLRLTELHNDYLQLYYNYGKMGLILFFIPFLVIILKVIRTQSEEFNHRLVKSLLITMFIPLIGFMLTDTTIKTSFSLMNYFFAIIGIFHSVDSCFILDNITDEDISSNTPLQ